MIEPAPTRDSVCGLVVTFNPDAGLEQRVRSLFDQLAHVIVVDNASAAAREMLSELTSRLADNTSVIRNSRNVGHAAALNQACRSAAERGAQWVLCLDQDSRPSPQLMSILREAYDAYDGQKPIGIVASNFGIPPIPGVEPQFDVKPYVQVLTAITSGSLIGLKAFQEVGGFREDFFIDSVDHEFCFRLLDRGYAILLSRKQGLQHAIGAPEPRKFLWKRVSTSNHSAVRRYYMSRNRLVLFREWRHKHPAWVRHMQRLHWREVIRWCLVEDDRLRKIYATLLGTFDALCGRMGKLQSRFIR